MNQFIDRTDTLQPWDRIAKPVDKFSWDLNALRAIVTQQESRIKHLEDCILGKPVQENVSHETKRGRPKKVENATSN